MPDAVPFPPRPPDERYESRLNVRIGRQRIALRVAVEATDVTDAPGPATVIPIRPPSERPQSG